MYMLIINGGRFIDSGTAEFRGRLAKCSLKIDGFMKQPVSNDYRSIYTDFRGCFMKKKP